MGNNMNKKLKIVFIGNNVTLIHGGIERLLCSLSNEMIGRGHDVTVFVRTDVDAAPVFPVDGKIKFVKFSDCGEQSDISRALDSIVSIAPDICVSLSSGASHLFWAAVLTPTGIPFIVSEHGDPKFIETDERIRSDRLSSMVVADCIHLLLKPYVNSLPEFMRKKVFIIPNPITPSSHIINLKEKIKEKKILLSIGRLEESTKQFSLAIKAFSLIEKNFSDWEYHIWGIGADKQILEETIRNLALEKRVFLKGLSTNVNQQYSEADIFCMPSKFEGCPVALGEALSYGVPAVGFVGCNGVSSLIQNDINGLLAPEMTAESFAESLSRLMGDADSRKRMGEAAIKSCEQFSPKIIFDKWENMLIETSEYKKSTQLTKLSTPEFKLMANLERIISSPNIYFRDEPSTIALMQKSRFWRLFMGIWRKVNKFNDLYCKFMKKRL